MSATSKAFRAYATLVGAAAGLLIGFLALVEPPPPVLALVLFAALVIYCTHRSIDFADGKSVNADNMIMMAAVVAFSRTSPLLGPALVGLARGLYISQIRARSWALIALNAASGVFAASLTAVSVGLIASPASASPLVSLLLAVVGSVVCNVTIAAVLAPAFVLRGQPWRDVAGSIAPQVFESLPFSVVGFFVGRLYVSIGASAILMLIVPIFIAREMYASYIRVRESHEETVGMLIRALEAKDRYTSGHSERVANYARYVGEHLGFMPARLERLRFAALMHDIGKLVVPNYLLNKPGRLTAEEFAQVRIHEKVSVQMLSHIDFLRPIATASHSDHTRFDPDDEDHPIEPYIVMIADAYDAMTSTRAYRKALSQEVAFQELRDKAGIQFHPACVEALIAALETRDEKHGAGFEDQHEFLNAPDAGLGSAGLGDLLPSEAGK